MMTQVTTHTPSTDVKVDNVNVFASHYGGVAVFVNTSEDFVNFRLTPTEARIIATSLLHAASEAEVGS